MTFKALTALLAFAIATQTVAAQADPIQRTLVPLRTSFSCTGPQTGALKFDTISLAVDRGVMSAPLTVACAPTVAFRIRLSSSNFCHLQGPRGKSIAYVVYSDPGYRTVVLDCQGPPVELSGRGATTFRLYAVTARFAQAPAGTYNDSLQVTVDTSSTAP